MKPYITLNGNISEKPNSYLCLGTTFFRLFVLQSVVPVDNPWSLIALLTTNSKSKPAET